MTRGVDAVSDEARNAAARATAAKSAQESAEDSIPSSSNTNLSVSPVITQLTNQYIATINPGEDGEIPGNDIGLNYGSNDRQVNLALSLQQLISNNSIEAGQVALTLSRTATQDAGVQAGRVDLAVSRTAALDAGLQVGRVDLTLSRTATQDVGINLGLPSGMSTSSDFDA
tara:strand:+ start:2184 stop:2696 length:513 start_codon:yes stop_codon:yes gene_type:complete